jgi:ABC-type proline/glycine betaine transport system substrate-binding protein
MQNAKPENALVALRNDSDKNKPVAFYRWSPSKIVGYLGKTCVETS